MAIRQQDQAQNFKTMENKINLEVIDQMFAAQMSANESQERIEDLRRDMKRTGEKLEKAYLDSESIKYGLTVAVMK